MKEKKNRNKKKSKHNEDDEDEEEEEDEYGCDVNRDPFMQSPSNKNNNNKRNSFHLSSDPLRDPAGCGSPSLTAVTVSPSSTIQSMSPFSPARHSSLTMTSPFHNRNRSATHSGSLIDETRFPPGASTRRHLLLLLYLMGVSFVSFVYFILPAFALVSLVIFTLTSALFVFMARSYIMFLLETQQVSLFPLLPSFIQRFATNSLLELMSGPSTMNQYRHLLLYAIPGLTPQQRRDFIQRLPAQQRALHLQPGALPSLLLPQGFRRLFLPLNHSHRRRSFSSISSSLTTPTHIMSPSPPPISPAALQQQQLQQQQQQQQQQQPGWLDTDLIGSSQGVNNNIFSLLLPIQNSTNFNMLEQIDTRMDNDGNSIHDFRYMDLDDENHQLSDANDPVDSSSTLPMDNTPFSESTSHGDPPENILADALSTMAQTYSNMVSHSISQVSQAIVESSASVVIPAGMYLSSFSMVGLWLTRYSSMLSRFWTNSTIFGRWTQTINAPGMILRDNYREEETNGNNTNSFLVTGLYSTAILGGISAGTMWWVRKRFRTNRKSKKESEGN